MRGEDYNTARSTPPPLSFAGGSRSGDKSMEQHADDPKNSDSTVSTVQSNIAEPAKFELPLDFDDILAVAILDSVLKVKRRRSKGRGTPRRHR